MFHDLSQEVHADLEGFDRPPVYTGINTKALWAAIAAHNAGAREEFVWRLLFEAMGVPEEVMQEP